PARRALKDNRDCGLRQGLATEPQSHRVNQRRVGFFVLFTSLWLCGSVANLRNPQSNSQETRMSHENLKRRDFIKGAATAGLSAPLLAGESPAEVSRQNQLSALGQARPVVISSANGANVPKRGVEPRGVSCVELAMRMLKGGRDTL